MLHRRLINDCNEDASYHQMNDSTIVISNSRFILTSPATAASLYHPLQLRLSHPVQVYFGTSAIPTKQYSGLVGTLPSNLHILTLQTLHTGKVILRIQHLYAINEDVDLSKPVTIDITTLFKFTMNAISETSVTGNQPLPLNRLVWKTGFLNNDEVSQILNATTSSNFQVGAPYNVTFQPMQIRTFVIDVTWP